MPDRPPELGRVDLRGGGGGGGTPLCYHAGMQLNSRIPYARDTLRKRFAVRLVAAGLMLSASSMAGAQQFRWSDGFGGFMDQAQPGMGSQATTKVMLSWEV